MNFWIFADLSKPLIGEVLISMYIDVKIGELYSAFMFYYNDV